MRPSRGRLKAVFRLAWIVVVAFGIGLAPATALDFGRLLNRFHQLGGVEGNFDDWRHLIDEARDIASVKDKLRRVNEFFNRRIQFADDQETWGQADYWATPMETLAKGKGDCEDFTIAKYFTLLNAGVPDQQLRLVYVKATIGGPESTLIQAHMVLAYYPSPDAEPLVLDNLITDIRPASRRPDLAPVFSFNDQGIWPGTAGGNARSAGGVGRLSRWQDLLQRVRQEGFD
jgi:predicted transglutaminase-like cysteine proteinase